MRAAQRGVFFILENKDSSDLLELLNKCNFPELRERLEKMNEVDIAEFMEGLNQEQTLLVFRILPKDISADVFSYLDADSRTGIVQAATDKELHVLVDDLYMDDTIDLLEEVPANVVRRVLASTDAHTRELINKFLKYPDNSAGSIMTIEMVELHDRFTVREAIDHIRKTGVDKETIYTCYCIDDARHLIGSVQLRHLIMADEDDLIRDIMDSMEYLRYVHTLDDQEEVADIVRKYDLLSVPVLDNEDRLVGIITVDDIVDVIEEENTEDIEKMNLLKPSGNDKPYLKTSVFRLAGNRIVWLLVLMISATFTSKIIENYEALLSGMVALTASIPMLMDTGGNAGSQSSTLIIRNLALGELTVRDYFRILWKELRVALICGVILGAVNLGRMLLLHSGTVAESMVTCLAMVCAVVVAKVIGCTLPIIAKVIRIDPALMAGPLITTLVDALTLLIYFSLAQAFLM